MSLLADGKSAVAAMAREDDLFPRIKPADWSAAAVKLAKKQVISAGLTAGDLNAVKGAISPAIFEKTLADLTAFQAKLLAKRIDPSVTQEEIASKSMALIVIRDRLGKADQTSDTGEPARAAAAPSDSAPDEPKKSNPYIGRKAFRVR
ncbi:MAG: hypothetical protein AAGJ32_00230 [Pseudomonadota bacterium]